MAHYAFLDENNIVTQVIVGKNENEEGINWEERYSEICNQKCKRTSYNTYKGVYYDPNTNTPAQDQTKAFRKNYAGIGYTYDAQRDAFIPPKPFNSWVLNEDSCTWDPPTPMPTNNNTGEFPKLYNWDEATTSWVEATV